MSTLWFLAPLGAAIVLAMAVTALHNRLPPRLATRIVAVTMLVVVAAALPTLWIVGLAFLAHTPVLDGGLEWCAKAFGAHRSVPVVVGAPALVAAAVGTWRAVGAIVTNRRLRRDAPGGVEVAGHRRPFAYTLPGRGGHIVVSTALVELLDDAEQDIVLAHEQAHADHRHDRYLLAGTITAATIPLLRPLAARLEHSLERWADEVAATRCGNRQLVAFTLGKVALGQVEQRGVLTFSGLGVAARVAALLGPPVHSPNRRLVAGLWGAIAGTAVLAIFQIHHLSDLVGALCPD